MDFLRRLFGGAPAAPPTPIPTLKISPERPEATLDIVGEASYQAALDRVGGGKTEYGAAFPDHVAVLVPEPRNKWDPNAIAVQIDGITVGYLSREDAIRYKPVVAMATEQGRFLACDARLTGGWYRSRNDTGSFGVDLNLGTPAECLLEMMGERVTVASDHPWVGRMVAFTGESRYSLAGVALDRESSHMLAERAGMSVHPRVTKKVQLLVDCDLTTTSGNERKALDYEIPVVSEAEFWAALGLPVETTP